MKHGFASTYEGVTFSETPSPLLEEYRKELAEISVLRTGDYATPEHALRLPRDANMFAEAQRVAKRYYSSQLKYIILVGIGGQNLGAKAVYDALRGPYDLAEKGDPKLLFLDTISGDALTSVEEIVREFVHYPEEFLVILSSKSGKTTETIANFELLYVTLRRRFQDINDRIILISDNGSVFWRMGEEKKFCLVPMPKAVGGRFSVFSTAGILPLLLAGVNVGEFREGAQDMLHNSVLESAENHARRNAEVLFRALRHGLSLYNIFHFNPRLESLGKWERQLIAESLGKESDISGKTVHTGITPIVSIGSTDLHSMAQLYLGGPRDKFTMFVHATEHYVKTVPHDPLSGDIISGIAGKRPGEIMDAILRGVMSAYGANKLPYNDVSLSSVSPYTLGAFMEWRIASTLYLAKLMHVNAFDQPNVEDYKKETRTILGTKSSR